jgi:serine protease
MDARKASRYGALTGLVAATALIGGMTATGATAATPASPTHSHLHGVVPTVQAAQAARSGHVLPAITSKTLQYGGGVDGIGVTTGKEKVYIVFWGTQWGTSSTDSNGNLKFSNDTAGAAGRVQQMIKGLGTGGEQWSGTMTQYCDGAVAAGATSCPAGSSHVAYPTGGGTLAGVWYDNSAAAPSAATEPQIAQEAINAAGHFGNTTAAANRYAQYVVFSAKGTNPDNYLTNGFCAWHDWNGDLGVSSPYGDIALTNLPYLLDAGASCGQSFVNRGSAGTLDGFTIVEGHEYAETITDQNPSGGWTHLSNNQENADECAWISHGQGAAANVTMGNGSYPMQSTWSNDTNRCDISHVTVS